MRDSITRLLISILFTIIITLFTILFYMIVLVILNEKSIDLGLFSIILFVIVCLIRVGWILIPLEFKFNTVSRRIFGGYVDGNNLKNVINSITILLVLILAIIGFINYLLYFELCWISMGNFPNW